MARIFNRKLSREIAMELIYQSSINPYGDDLLEAVNSNFELKEKEREDLDLNYIMRVVKAVEENREEIRDLIESHLEGWKIERISRINYSILSLAVAEMKFLDDIPEKVSINEALNLTEKYGDEKDKKFINGVLDKIYRG